MDRGLFITVEGIDGCGKSTQAVRIADALERRGRDVVRLREPGGVAISERIRGILLDPSHGEMGDVCELLLYEAARAQLVHEVVAPALRAGRTVVCDRFYDSTTAYQAYANGLDRTLVAQANAIAVDGWHPDVTLVFDVPVQEALARRTGRSAADRLELKGTAYQERVAAGFRALAEQEPRRIALIDASGSIDEVFAAAWSAVEAVIAGSAGGVFEQAEGAGIVENEGRQG